MKKTLLFLIAILFSYSYVFAQSEPLNGNGKHDSITPVPCVFEYQLSYDNLMFIPDGPNCSGLGECYNTFVTYSSYPAGSMVMAATDIQSVCMKIEHSYMGDLQFRLICPNGNSVILHSQPNGGNLYLGLPVDDQGSCTPNDSIIGEGWNYCWSENPNYSYHGAIPNYIHQGQTTTSCDSTDRTNQSNYYHPMNSFAGLVGCPLNGTWSLEICDFFGIDDGWIWDWSINMSNLSSSVTGGIIYFDQNQNCQRDLNEMGLANRHAVIQPAGIYVQTNASGAWWVDSLPIGNYTITVDTLNDWQNLCGATQSFSVTDTGMTIAPCLGLYSSSPCSAPEVSIFAPSLRPCFANQQIYVLAENQNYATTLIYDANVVVHLDSLIQVNGASIPYVSEGADTYRFFTGTLFPGQQKPFTITTTVSCNALVGQTLCMEAQILPVPSCFYDSVVTPVFPDGVSPCNTPWDNSSLSVEGWCANDTIYFTITNTGDAVTGNMTCYTPVRVYVDGVLTYFDSLMIAGGQSVTYAYPGNGQTWILQTDQHPLHPGNSHPNAHVEACGNLNNWTPDLVNDFPLNDAESLVDIYCGTVTASLDPNDKTGYPHGVGSDHYVTSNQQLQYVIQFQNTGTDTAFTVIVRDTLDADFNVFSVTPGVASHPYTFRIYGTRVLEWSFNRILLPDSNSNEPASHGFATFTVNPNPGLPKGTVLNNTADIYFDFNPPVITNTTLHTINSIQTVLPVEIHELSTIRDESIRIYPNPATNDVSVFIAPEFVGQNYTLYNYLGQPVCSGKLINQESKISLNTVSQGVYLLKIGTSHKFTLKIVKN